MKTTRRRLIAAALCLIVSVAITLKLGTTEPAENYETKLAAAELMEACMEAIRGYRVALDISIGGEDIHSTGLIGESYTEITTTLGSIEAKRTTANSDMAALMVQLLEEAGISAGDHVAAGFSGSFPAMNLATIAACEAMGVTLTYISSVGSSTYGANLPQLTFPDMLAQLVEDGVIAQAPAALSLGGASDLGEDFDPSAREVILSRLEQGDIPLILEEDYQENLAIRQQIYAAVGVVDCFIGVGGNITSSGTGNEQLSWGVIPGDTVHIVKDTSGLLERYNAMGIPVIQILNIKDLVMDYALPYDPETLPEPGESAIYTQSSYFKIIPLIGVVLAVVIMKIKKK